MPEIFCILQKKEFLTQSQQRVNDLILNFRWIRSVKIRIRLLNASFLFPWIDIVHPVTQNQWCLKNAEWRVQENKNRRNYECITQNSQYMQVSRKRQRALVQRSSPGRTQWITLLWWGKLQNIGLWQLNLEPGKEKHHDLSSHWYCCCCHI